MSLQGSLDSFALPDVMRLLASTNKTGELQVKTRRCAGQLWVKSGSLIGGAAGESLQVVDVVFELLRSESGTFAFVEDRPAARPSDPVSVDGVLAEVEDRLIEWREIEAIIPTINAHLSLVALISGEVMFDADEWATIVAIGSGAKVVDVMKALELNEFVACKRAKLLIEAGVVAVTVHDGDDPLFYEPETDVTFLSSEPDLSGEADEASEAGEVEGASAKISPIDRAAHATSDENGDDDAAMTRWEEIRRLAGVDEESTEEELTPEEQERAKELIEAHGAETPKDETINRGLLLKFLASAQTSA